jgi:hypothetical protein
MKTTPEAQEAKLSTEHKAQLILAMIACVMALLVAVAGLIGVHRAFESEAAAKSSEKAAIEVERDRVRSEVVHNQALDVEAKAKIAATTVEVRIPERSPALDSCRMVIWTIPASAIQKAATSDAEPVTRPLYSTPRDSIGNWEGLSFARTKPVVTTSFRTAHDYITSHPELKPVIEPTCSDTPSSESVNVSIQTGSGPFSEGTTVVGLPYK